MKVYLSWSGERSRRAALILGEWLPWVIPFTEPFVPAQSGDGIPWNREREEAALDTGFGILCVTRKNLYSPWLLFEAGALLMAAEQPCVAAWFLDMDPMEAGGPVSLFQSVTCEEESLQGLIYAVNRACGENGVPEDRLGSTFAYWYPDLRDNLADLGEMDDRARQRDTAAVRKPSPMEELMALSRENQKLLRVSDARVDVGLSDLRRGVDDLRRRMDDLLMRLGREPGPDRRQAFPRGDRLTQDQIDRLIRMYRWRIEPLQE